MMNPSNLRPQNLTRRPSQRDPSFKEMKFPFSSPVTAEAPRSILAESPTRPMNPFTDNESDDTSGQDDFGLERYTLGGSYKPWKGSEEQRRQRGGSGRSQRRISPTQEEPFEESQDYEEAKKRRPGLNVVTNFSKGDGRAYTEGDQWKAQAGTQIQNRSYSEDSAAKATQKPNNAPMFVSLDDLKELASTGKQKAGLPPKYKPGTEQTRFLSPEQRRAVGAELSSSKSTDLSPSDRPIMIGIQVPSQDRGDYTPPDSRMTSAKSDATPSIVITPAKEDAPWNTASRRRASSVYSQATPYIGASINTGHIPPVPTIPSTHNGSKGGADGSNDFSLSGRRERTMSSDTVFEDDDDLQIVTRARSGSDDSQRGILHRSSLDTINARHQSRGWWNLMLSPLLTRSNTIASKKGLAIESETPQVPSLAKAAQIAGDSHQDGARPRASDLPGSQMNKDLWTDVGQREQQRNLPPEVQESQHKTQDSSGTIQFMMASPVKEGSAEEYFRACAHDLVNPLPYFECQNHSCALESGQRRVAENPATKLETDGSSRELPATVTAAAIVGETATKDTKNQSNNPFFQAPSNRFSAAFREASLNRDRPESVSTVIEDEPELSPEMSPNIREANAAQVVRAKGPATGKGTADAREEASQAPAAAESSKQSPTIPPPYSPPRITRFPRYVAIMPPDRQPRVQDSVPSPGPISPGGQQATATRGGIPMAEMPNGSPAPQNWTVNNHYYAGGLPPRPNAAPLNLAAIDPPNAARQKIEARRQRLEKEDAVGKKVGGLWRGRGCFSDRGCFGRGGPEGRKRKRWYLVIASVLLTIVIVSIVLATTLTRKGDNTPVQSQWLNLTGFPPMPTGISTIAQPDVQSAKTGCVHPSTMWSCDLPKEQQQSVAPNDPNQPNFRLEIRFRNGTIANQNGSSPNAVKTSRRSVRNAVTAGGFIRNRLLRARDAFTDALYTPSPAPPNLEDQDFLGNTTDNITAPFVGEDTPFYITFLSPAPSLPNRLVKRQNSTNANSTNPDFTDSIPPPSTNPDGTASPANLLPFPSSQPVRLYNRDQDTEHYGFYTYFDRSIFLKSTTLLNSSDTGDVPGDDNGGSTESGADFRCTWAQTRFLVQIWTRPDRNGMVLLQNSNSSSGATQTSSRTSSSTKNDATSSATDFSRPGSFPYPVTITLDRHGGDINKKMVYCYGMDDRQQIVSSEKKFVVEYRDFGGQLVNPALGPFEQVNVSLADGGPGGIDGGTGGCNCQWINWAGN